MNRFSKLLAAVGVIVIFAAVADGSTGASFPGTNGRLIFVLASSSQIHSIYPDGTGLTNLGNGTEPTWSPDGTKVAYSESLYYNMDIFVMRADGSGKVNLTNTSDTTNPTYETQARWSPDGAKIAYYKSITQYTTSNIVDIWLMNADGTGQTNLTNTPPGNFELDPRWSPDGAKIAFTRNVDSQSTVWVMNVDGSGQIKISSDALAAAREPAWSPDSQRLVFEGSQPFQGNADVYVANADGTGMLNLTPGTPNRERRPIWSSDGSRIIFERELPEVYEDQFEIFSMNADGSGQTNLTNVAGNDVKPILSPDGTRIAYVNDRIVGVTQAYTMNPDGSQLRQVGNVHVSSASSDDLLDWQPLPDDADDDNDGLSDATELACGSDPLRDDRRPERIDGPFAGVDDDNDAAVDEPLPAGAANFDCDGDGYRGSAEDHVYSYLSQANGDQKTCQEYDGGFPNPAAHIRPSLRWPSDLAGGSFSSNKINIQDSAAFTNPIRYLNQDVGTDANDVRFDLVPGSAVGADINIADLAAITSGATAFPPMLGGSKAFNGPDCPWPP